uniref:BTB domain-containing protein n=1 Tax=Parastrongyloides trichosuri TaxID=131310 RepID=A0A0N4Z4D5_PARTI
MIFRKIEKILHVHPEKYRSRGAIGSRRSTPGKGGFDHDKLHVRSASEELRQRSLQSTPPESLSYNDSNNSKQLEELSIPIPVDATIVGERKVDSEYWNPNQINENNIKWRNEEVITINVSGMRFQTYESTLSRFPNSLLGHPGKRAKYWNNKTQEYFLDHSRYCFESILNIYQTNGDVRRPELIPLEIYLKELKFFEMNEEVMENFWISEGYEKPIEQEMPRNPVQRYIWELMEYPDSSVPARVLAFISISVIVTSIVSFCLETLPDFREASDTMTETGYSKWNNPFLILESLCIVWFSIELFLRFISCPSKRVFMKSFLNIVDFIAIAPFFINFIWSEGNKNNSSTSFAVLRVLRLVRVFRIFKLSRHSVGLQILGKTFRASVQEFCLLIFFMVIALVLFSSAIFYVEQGETDTRFTSIPASFWFVVATMTTVGYGDLVPTGTYGKLVGSLCALLGVLTLALPVPIIVANFKHFYRQECRLAAMRVSREIDDASRFNESEEDYTT